jgi:hypothetical protein
MSDPETRTGGRPSAGPVAATILLFAAGAYTVAYLRIASPVRYEILSAIPVGSPTSFVKLEIEGVGPAAEPWLRWAFGPMEALDRCVRPGVWAPR